ncbi:MAG: transferase [Desulfobacterales bacterium]|nr:transferase [Desulfobacterales bacterium]MBF0395805.1 transferase [Desulfobacterales bacterium]
MKELQKVINRIIERVNVNLRELDIDVNSYIGEIIPLNQLVKFYGFYGITPHHPLDFDFRYSNLAGSCFLGKCSVNNSVIYKSDIRGDELKKRGEYFEYNGYKIPINDDEIIKIIDSLLVKTLVHNYSHDPENLEEFLIKNSISLHYANIHGSKIEGCFVLPFSTIDLTTGHDCIIGAFSYIQAEEIEHLDIKDGTVWVRNKDDFNFFYRFNEGILKKYINFEPNKRPQGIFMDFVEERKLDFEHIYDKVKSKTDINIPYGASIDRYALVKGNTRISENVLVAQRAYIQDSIMGKGANAQEHCYIINSCLEGYNVTAHGGKVINSMLGQKVFVGFNSFLRGKPDAVLTIGEESIVMPHTIIDLEEKVDIPKRHIVWGYIKNQKDIESNSASIDNFLKIKEGAIYGNLIFKGNGEYFVRAFQNRIEHILEANGAYFDGNRNRGHAQNNQNISFNIIQPYPEGELEGLYPTINIKPLMPIQNN